MKDAMVVNVLELKGCDELSQTDDAVKPAVYDDGTVEICIELVGNRSVYITFHVADLVAIATTGERDAK